MLLRCHFFVKFPTDNSTYNNSHTLRNSAGASAPCGFLYAALRRRCAPRASTRGVSQSAYRVRRWAGRDACLGCQSAVARVGNTCQSFVLANLAAVGKPRLLRALLISERSPCQARANSAADNASPRTKDRYARVTGMRRLLMRSDRLLRYVRRSWENSWSPQKSLVIYRWQQRGV